VLSNLPTIYFIRHGETDWNKQSLIQGSIDTDLNAHGIAQAQAVAAALAQRRDELAGFQFYVSPQKRAQQTMGYITQAMGMPMASVKVDGRLRELGFGIWEAKPFWELKASPIYPADAESRYGWTPEGGESYADGVVRVEAFLNELVGPALMVSHGAVGRCLMGYVAGMDHAQLVSLKTPQGCYCRLQYGQIDWFDANHDAA
jgi:broad specificity phosphatase PhoE